MFFPLHRPNLFLRKKNRSSVFFLPEEKNNKSRGLKDLYFTIVIFLFKHTKRYKFNSIFGISARHLSF